MAPQCKPLKRLRTAKYTFRVYNLKGQSRRKKQTLNLGGVKNSHIHERDVTTAEGDLLGPFQKTTTDSNDGESDKRGRPRQYEHDGLTENAFQATYDCNGGKNVSSTHAKRKEREEAAWEKAREGLQKAHIKEQYLPTNAVCVECVEKTTKPKQAVCRCLDCGWRQYFCYDCALAIHCHRGTFHLLELWKDGTFQPMFFNTYVLSPPGHGDECGSIYDIRTVTLIDLQGRQHLKKVQFCKCQTDAEALVSMGYWPSSIERPVVAFDMQLLELFRLLLLECHVSLDKLCSMVSLWKSPLLPNHVQHIYRTLNSSSFDEYRLFKDSLGIQQDSCVLCPLPGEKGVLIEMMDACFGFVRKKSAGSSVNHPRYEMRMFADQEDVDNFITKHSKFSGKSENPCSQYRAGEITDCIRSKGRNEKYDEKAVFGRICRHGHPKGFISLKHGERISYAVYELQRMIEPYKNSMETEIKCMYDIACILDTHLEKNNDYGLEDFLERVQFGIPLFHAYVHKAKCQVKYSPRRNVGFGLTDGEAIERLWSYLRKFAYMTKEMQPSRRTDMLSEALLHYAKRMLHNQGKHLTNSLEKAEDLRQKSALELRKCIDSIPEMKNKELSSVVLESWREEELSIVTKRNAAPLVANTTWKEQYADLIWNHFLLRNTVAAANVEETIDGQNNTKSVLSKMKTLEEKLKSLEKSRGLKKRWKLTDASFTTAITVAETTKHRNIIDRLHAMAVERQIQLMLKERYSRGQKQAVRLARRCTKQTKRIKAEIAKYNARLSSLKEHVPVPLRLLNFDEVKDLKSPLYNKIELSKSIAGTTISFAVKKRILELKDLEERCDEEKSLLHSECKRMINWHVHLAEKLKSESLTRSANLDNFSKGLSAVLRKQSLVIEKEILENKQTYNRFDICIPDSIIEHNCFYTAQLRSDMNNELMDEDSDFDATSSDSDSEDEDQLLV